MTRFRLVWRFATFFSRDNVGMGTPQVAKKLGVTESQVGHEFENTPMLVPWQWRGRPVLLSIIAIGYQSDKWKGRFCGNEDL